MAFILSLEVEKNVYFMSGENILYILSVCTERSLFLPLSLAFAFLYIAGHTCLHLLMYAYIRLPPSPSALSLCALTSSVVAQNDHTVSRCLLTISL